MEGEKRNTCVIQVLIRAPIQVPLIKACTKNTMQNTHTQKRKPTRTHAHNKDQNKTKQGAALKQQNGSTTLFEMTDYITGLAGASIMEI